MYILKSLLAFSLLFPIFVCNAQEKDIAKNSVFLEIFGTGGLYSINYEKTINPLVFIRLGGNHFKFKSKEEVLTVTSFPAMVTILTGEKKNHIELSGGTLIGYTKDHQTTKPILNFTFFVGYRFQP